MKPKTYTVLYWSGGNAVGRWNEVLVAYPTWGAANESANEVRKGGRVAYVYETAKLAALGWPEGPPAELVARSAA